MHRSASATRRCILHLGKLKQLVAKSGRRKSSMRRVRNKKEGKHGHDDEHQTMFAIRTQPSIKEIKTLCQPCQLLFHTHSPTHQLFYFTIQFQ